MLLLTNDLGMENQSNLFATEVLSHNIYGADSNLLCYCFPPCAPTPVSPSLALPLVPSLLLNSFCTTLNHFVSRFQRDAGGNRLQLYGIKANKTRLNLSVEASWLEGIAGISGWVLYPIQLTSHLSSPVPCVLKYHNSDTENPFLFCIVLYTCLPFPLALF